MKIGILRERETGERRVAVVPRDVAPLIEAGHEVRVEAGAGVRAFIDDSL
ncbi:MAG: NAD(P)(+) transhydrogenase (Re/Si-specific) subunit alpha, partial [Dehalococcoidia bacterium]